MIIIKDLGMRKVCEKKKIVLRLLNEDQEKRCLQVYQEVIERLKAEPDILRRVVTGDETCFFFSTLLKKLIFFAVSSRIFFALYNTTSESSQFESLL